jgi:tRNA threonylcarbamoyladenosine biosynthesis protein TsaE
MEVTSPEGAPMKAFPVGDRPWRRPVADEAAVGDLAAACARAVEAPATIFLRGDLGAGKTTFARAYIHALGFEGYVKSPSYGLLEIYAAGGQVVLHLDLYRIEDPEELEYLAIRDQLGDKTVLLVEWPDRGGRDLPPPDLLLDFGETEGARFIECTGCSERGRAMAARLFRNID